MAVDHDTSAPQFISVDASPNLSERAYGVVVQGSYMILRGLTVVGGESGVFIDPGSHHIVIEGCDISGYGRDDWGAGRPRLERRGNWRRSGCGGWTRMGAADARIGCYVAGGDVGADGAAASAGARRIKGRKTIS